MASHLLPSGGTFKHLLHCTLAPPAGSCQQHFLVAPPHSTSCTTLTFSNTPTSSSSLLIFISALTLVLFAPNLTTHPPFNFSTTHIHIYFIRPIYISFYTILHHLLQFSQTTITTYFIKYQIINIRRPACVLLSCSMC